MVHSEEHIQVKREQTEAQDHQEETDREQLPRKEHLKIRTGERSAMRIPGGVPLTCMMTRHLHINP